MRPVADNLEEDAAVEVPLPMAKVAERINAAEAAVRPTAYLERIAIVPSEPGQPANPAPKPLRPPRSPTGAAADNPGNNAATYPAKSNDAIPMQRHRNTSFLPFPNGSYEFPAVQKPPTPTILQRNKAIPLPGAQFAKRWGFSAPSEKARPENRHRFPARDDSDGIPARPSAVRTALAAPTLKERRPEPRQTGKEKDP